MLGMTSSISEELQYLDLLDELHSGEAGDVGGGAEGGLQPLQLARFGPTRAQERAHQQRLQHQMPSLDALTISAPCPDAHVYQLMCIRHDYMGCENEAVVT